MQSIGFTIGKFAPLHKGHEFLIETALKEVDKMYVVIYETDLINIDIEKRASWIKRLYPTINIIYAFNSPKQYGLDKESVDIQMKYLCRLIKDIPVTKFYSSEPYGRKVAEYLKIENREVDIDKKIFPVSANKIRENYKAYKKYMEEFVFKEIIEEEEKSINAKI